MNLDQLLRDAGEEFDWMIAQRDRAAVGDSDGATLRHRPRVRPAPLITAAAVVGVGIAGLVVVDGRSGDKPTKPAESITQSTPALGPSTTAVPTSAQPDMPSQNEVIGTSPVVDLGAADAADRIRELGAAIPLPPGGSFDDVIRNLTGEPSIWNELGVQSTLEFNAACQWATSWLTANAAGDDAGKADAQEVLDQVPQWPALVAVDVTGDGTRQWDAIADAARAGDPERLMDAGYQVNCNTIQPGF